MYDIIFSEKAIEDILRLRKSEPAAYKKVGKLIEDLNYTLQQVQDIQNN